MALRELGLVAYWPANPRYAPCDSISKVMANLYISGIEGAKDYAKLRQLGITHILNMVGPALYHHPEAGGPDNSYFPQLFAYKIITADDSPGQVCMPYDMEICMLRAPPLN